MHGTVCSLSRLDPRSLLCLYCIHAYSMNRGALDLIKPSTSKSLGLPFMTCCHVLRMASS